MILKKRKKKKNSHPFFSFSFFSLRNKNTRTTINDIAFTIIHSYYKLWVTLFTCMINCEQWSYEPILLYMHITFSPLFIIWHRKELRQKLYHSTQHFCLRRLDSKVQVPQMRWEEQVTTAGLWSSLVPSAKYFPTILLTKSGMYFRVPVPKRLKTLV